MGKHDDGGPRELFDPFDQLQITACTPNGALLYRALRQEQPPQGAAFAFGEWPAHATSAMFLRLAR